MKHNSKKNINLTLPGTLSKYAEAIIRNSSKSIFSYLLHNTCTWKHILIEQFLNPKETLKVVHGASQYGKEVISLSGPNRKIDNTLLTCLYYLVITARVSCMLLMY